jgi:hypothetical protein
MDILARIFASLGVALGSSAYLGLMLRSYNAKRLFREVAIISFIVSMIAFYVTMVERSYLLTIGLGGTFAGITLFVIRKVLLRVEEKYKQDRKDRGEKVG